MRLQSAPGSAASAQAGGAEYARVRLLFVAFSLTHEHTRALRRLGEHPLPPRSLSESGIAERRLSRACTGGGHPQDMVDPCVSRVARARSGGAPAVLQFFSAVHCCPKPYSSPTPPDQLGLCHFPNRIECNSEKPFFALNPS